MYDRPNAIKGRYVKIPNMLIFVAEPVNHEVIGLWSLVIKLMLRENSVHEKYISIILFLIII